jgi:hypothetical protein
MDWHGADGCYRCGTLGPRFRSESAEAMMTVTNKKRPPL